MPFPDTDQSPIVVDENPLLTPEEEKLIESTKRSRVWRLIRDSLALEREQLTRLEVDAEASNLVFRLGKKEGRLAAVNRLLNLGPLLVVLYQRYVREQARKGEDAVAADAPTRPGEPPDLT